MNDPKPGSLLFNAVQCVFSEISHILRDRRVRFLLGDSGGPVLFLLRDSCPTYLTACDFPKGHATYEISQRIKIPGARSIYSFEEKNAKSIYISETIRVFNLT